MIWEIYSYWNVSELAAVFEAVAMLTQAEDYGQLIAIALIVGVAVAALGTLTGAKDGLSGGRYFLTGLFLYAVFAIPKADVAMIDKTGTKGAIVVQNVPFTLAVFGHLTSRVGDWLTVSYETTMTTIVPSYANDGVPFVGNGLMFGQKLIEKAELARGGGVTYQQNMAEFFNQCVFPEIDRGTISINDIKSNADTWAAINNMNPSLYVSLFNSDGTRTSPMTCSVAYNSVMPGIINSASDNVLQKLTGEVYPQALPAVARATLESSLSGSYSYFLGTSEDATSIIKQNIISNAFFDTSVDNRVATGAVVAQESAKVNYGILHEVAQNLLPKLRNIIEAVLYAVFPIIMLMIIAAGEKGLTVVKSYIVSLVWIQLWAPLYAIMNFMVSSFDATAMTSSAFSSGSGLSLSHNDLLAEQILSSTEIAGMMAMAIPMLAYALVKGGEMAMTAFVQGATNPVNMAASQSAREMATGSLSMGNTSLDNTSTGTHSALNYDTQPNVNMGGAKYTNQGGMSYGDLGNGNTTWNSTGAENAGKMVSLAQAYSNVSQATQSLGKATEAVETTGMAANISTGSAAASANLYSHGANNGTTWGAGVGTNMTEGVQNAFKQSQSVIDKLHNEHGYSREAATQVVQAANAGAGWNDSIIPGITANTKLQLSDDQKEAAKNVYSSAMSDVSKDDLEKAASMVQDVTSNQNVQGNIGLSTEARNSLTSSTSTNADLLEKHEAAISEKETYQSQLAEQQQKANTLQADITSMSNFNALPQEQQDLLGGGLRKMQNQIQDAANNGDWDKVNQLQNVRENSLNQLTASLGQKPFEPIAQVGDNNVALNTNGVQATNAQNQSTVSQTNQATDGKVNSTIAGAGVVIASGRESVYNTAEKTQSEVNNRTVAVDETLENASAKSAQVQSKVEQKVEENYVNRELKDGVKQDMVDNFNKGNLDKKDAPKQDIFGIGP